jgi:hypothetical protein
MSYCHLSTLRFQNFIFNKSVKISCYNKIQLMCYIGILLVTLLSLFLVWFICDLSMKMLGTRTVVLLRYNGNRIPMRMSYEVSEEELKDGLLVFATDLQALHYQTQRGF